jgi:hypothetical protein
MSDNDDDFKKQKLSGDDKVRAKYGDHAESYSAAEAGLGNGIVRERKITDCICLLTFVGFIFAMGYLTNYSLKHG